MYSAHSRFICRKAPTSSHLKNGFVAFSSAIVELGRAALDGGADALTVANTYLAMAIDPETLKPRIHTITAGLSGPAIKPITLRMVYQVTKALPIAVVAAGGIVSAADGR